MKDDDIKKKVLLRIKEGLGANKTRMVKNGIVQTDESDVKTRIKYLKLYCKIFGVYFNKDFSIEKIDSMMEEARKTLDEEIRKL